MVINHSEELLEAIKNKDEQSAYMAFYHLVNELGINVVSFHSYFGVSTRTFWGPTTSVETVNWEKLENKFLEVLKDYRNKASNQDGDLIEKTENVIKSLNHILEMPYEVTCFTCGTLIHANEAKCPKCGWSWKDK